MNRMVGWNIDSSILVNRLLLSSHLYREVRTLYLLLPVLCSRLGVNQHNGINIKSAAVSMTWLEYRATRAVLTT